jgi:ADP-ribosylglycohydrolase
MEKLKSRKFWVSIITMVASVAGALGGIGGDVGTVACIVGAIASPLVYVLTEGVIDAMAVDKTATAVKEIMEYINKLKDGE